MAKRKLRRFSGMEKVGIVKQHLVDKVAVSDLCDQKGLQPTQFYQWQKQLFEKGAKAFEQSSKTAAESKIVALEAILVRRNAGLAEHPSVPI